MDVYESKIVGGQPVRGDKIEEASIGRTQITNPNMVGFVFLWLCIANVLNYYSLLVCGLVELSPKNYILLFALGTTVDTPFKTIKR